MTVKTTLYLDEELKASIEFAARERQVPEAKVIRDALRAALPDPAIEKPHGGLFSGGRPIDWNSNDHLAGFGEW
jgi:hypothetical protein